MSHARASRDQHGSESWLAGFVVLSAIWGSSFLFIKVAVGDVAALDVALVRVALGTATLLALGLARRDSLPRAPRTWGHLAVVALLANTVPFSLIAYGETHVSSVLAGLWNAATPLLTLLAVAALLRDERPTRGRVLGLAIGFVGVVIVLGPWQGLGGGVLLGNLACLGAAACYGLSFAYTRRYLAVVSASNVSLSAAQLLCATAQLAVLAPLIAPAPGAVSSDAVLSLLALGIAGTGLAYVLNYRMIRTVGATRASTVTYLIPLFSTVLGTAVLGERLRWHEPVGAAIVLAGVALSNRGARARYGRSGAGALATAAAPSMRRSSSAP